MDGLPRSFNRKPAEVHNAFHAGDYFFHLHQIGKICSDKVLVLGKIDGGTDFARADTRVDALQELAQACTDIAGGAGDQDFLHGRHWTLFSAASFS